MFGCDKTFLQLFDILKHNVVSPIGCQGPADLSGELIFVALST